VPKIMLLTAIVAALGMVPQPSEADDGGFASRPFPGHFGPTLQLPQHGRDFHGGSFFAKPGPFEPQHFGRFDHMYFVFEFGHVRQFEPRRFGHFGQGGLVLKLGNGDFVLGFAPVPLFKPDHFGDRPQHEGPFFGFGELRPFGSWHDRGFAFEDRHQPPEHQDSLPNSRGDQGGGLHGGGPPEALLRELERIGLSLRARASAWLGSLT
jgi:hypothetical protein